MGVSDKMLRISDDRVISSTPSTTQDDQVPHDDVELRTFEPVKVNTFVNDNDNDNDNDNNDGFKTPTGIQNKITVNYSCPPPAPRKLMPKSMKRRRLHDNNKSSMMRFLQVSHQDLELLFQPRSVVLQRGFIDRASSDGIKKVDKPNLGTFMSFR